jgi:tetratricopeptide (TPR) repeat protein
MFHDFVTFIETHQWWFIIGIVVGLIIWFFRKGRPGEMEVKVVPPEIKVKRPESDGQKPPKDPPASAPALGSVKITGGVAMLGGEAKDIKLVGRDEVEAETIINDSMVTVYQGLPAAATIPFAAPAVATCTPERSHVTKFVNRGNIMNELRAALREGQKAAVVGVGGMGGVGKTELALYLYCELEEEMPGYPLWITAADRPLAAIHQDMARSLSIIFPLTADDETKAGILRAAFHEKARAVFIDDVRPGLVPVLHLCLPPSNCPALITSRLTELPPLPAGAIRPLDVMTENQSLELLNNVPDLMAAVTREPDAADCLAEACCYHPLALDLAARRLRMTLNFPEPIATFVCNLKDRMTQLKVSEGPLGSLEANFEISYSDLNPEDQARFRKLAVFAPSGFSPSAAAAVWDDEGTVAENAISRMQSYSLIQYASEPGRFRLHDLIRDYSLAKLKNSGELKQAYQKHAGYLITLFENHQTDDLSTAPALFNELDNLLEAANQAMEQKATDDLARLATATRNWMLVIFRVWNEWEKWLDAAIYLGIDDLRLEASVYMSKGDIYNFRGNYNEALDSFSTALNLYKGLDDRSGQANVILSIADILRLQGDNDAAMKGCKSALDLFLDKGERLGRANVLKCMGDIKRSEEDYDYAMQSYHEARKIYRDEKNLLGEAHVLCGQSRVMLFRNKLKDSEELFDHALNIYKAIGDRYSMAAQLANFGQSLICIGEEYRGSDYLSRAAHIFEDIGMHDHAAELRESTRV